MGRNADYSEAAILDAIKAIHAEAGRVTSFAVRKRLGGGNLTRIQALLDAWREDKDGASGEVELPPELKGDLMDVTEGLAASLQGFALRAFAAATKAAEARFEATLADERTRSEEMARELTEARELVDRQDEELSGLRDDLEATRSRLVEVATEVQLTKEAMVADHAAAEQAARDAASEIARLTSEVAQARSDASVSHAKAEAAREESERVRSGAEERIARLETALSDANGRASTGEREATTYKERLSAAETEMARLTKDIETAGKAKAEAETEARRQSEERQTSDAEARSARESLRREEEARSKADAKAEEEHRLRMEAETRASVLEGRIAELDKQPKPRVRKPRVPKAAAASA